MVKKGHKFSPLTNARRNVSLRLTGLQQLEERHERERAQKIRLLREAEDLLMEYDPDYEYALVEGDETVMDAAARRANEQRKAYLELRQREGGRQL